MMTESTINIAVDIGTLIAIVAFGLRFARHMGNIEAKVDVLWALAIDKWKASE